MITIGEIANELGARVSGAGIEAPVNRARSAVTHDSRRVVPGGIFVAIQGAHTDGNRFVGEAAKRGAIAIVSEQSRPEGYSGVWIEVADARIALSSRGLACPGKSLEAAQSRRHHRYERQDNDCASGHLDQSGGR